MGVMTNIGSSGIQPTRGPGGAAPAPRKDKGHKRKEAALPAAPATTPITPDLTATPQARVKRTRISPAPATAPGAETWTPRTAPSPLLALIESYVTSNLDEMEPFIRSFEDPEHRQAVRQAF